MKNKKTNKNIINAGFLAVLAALLPSFLFGWESGPDIHTTAPYSDASVYLSADADNISVQDGFEADLAVLLRLEGDAGQTVFSHPDSANGFDGNVWLKMDESTAAGKDSGNIVLTNSRTVSGDVNIWLSNYSYAGGTTEIRSAYGPTLGGNVNIRLDDSTVTTVFGINGKVSGDMNIEMASSTTTNLYATMYGGCGIGGDLNVKLKDSNVGGQTILLNDKWGDAGYVNGSVWFSLDGGTTGGSIRLGPNNHGGGDTFLPGRVKGDINAVVGGRWDDEMQSWVVSGTPTSVGATELESILMTGGRKGAADGNTNLVILSGTYAGYVCMGPNAATLGSAENPGSGNATLSIKGGTFSRAIYVASHRASSTGVSEGDGVVGEVLGNATLNVSVSAEPVVFNADIHLGALTGSVTDFVLGSYVLRTRQNFLRGDATANFEGDLSGIAFKSGVSIKAKTATTNVGGDAVFNFINATGKIGAKIDGFDRVVFDENSKVITADAINADKLVFHLAPGRSDAVLILESGGSVKDGADFEIVVDETFEVFDGERIDIISASGQAVSGNVSVIYSDGRSADRDWAADYTEGLSIIFPNGKLEPAQIESVKVSGGNVSFEAASKNTGGYYAVFSAPSLEALESQWTFTGAKGSIESDGSISAVFETKGTERFYRVLVSSAEYADDGSINSDTVYSTNAGGYYTMSFPARVWQYAANQLDQENQLISALFSALPSGSQISYYDAQGTPITAAKRPNGSWTNDASIPRGSVVKVYAGAEASVVVSGTLDDSPVSKQILGRVATLTCSSLPVGGDPVADFGIAKASGISVTQVDGGGVPSSRSTLPNGNWSSSGVPFVRVGEAFQLTYGSSKTWSQTLLIYTDSPVMEILVDFN